MENGSLQKDNSDGSNVDSHTKKHKRKRVSVEESAGVVATVEEAKLERKKRRTEKKKDGQKLQDGTSDSHLQSENSTKDIADIGLPDDSESRPEAKEKEIPTKKAKKHKHRQVPTIVEEPVHDTTAAVEMVQKTKKHKKRSTTDLHVDRSTPPVDLDDTMAEKSSKQKRKHKHKHELVESTEDPDSTPGEEKQHKKKRKHREMDSETARMETSEPTESLIGRKKKAKSSSQDNIYPNPDEDNKLTEAALKALVYVYTRVSSYSDWKFNKARQNWVVRNLWDAEAIPDTYFPSCVKYVADIRGNARDLLIKSGKSVLDSMPVQPDADVKAVDKGKASEGSRGADEGEPSEEQSRKKQMGVKRAEIILAELGVDPRSEK